MIPTEAFELDAVLISALHEIHPDHLLPHVLSMPWAHPANLRCQYALMVSLPIAFEVELGLAGKAHMALLAGCLEEACTKPVPPRHYRTDGATIWLVN